MSAPSHMQCKPVPSASEPPNENCRDYLRTGRCKYGASCKYNHPANVQSGGGLKAPLDPSEPMFPVRPGEPICQYYMKHFTCKFGQACKFNHPPQIAVGAGGGGMDGGNPLLVGTGGRKNDGVTHVEWNAGPGQGIQMLPQRPGEANCIFFLKNGRCKYGATCRYHHPLDYHSRRNDDTRRQPVQMHQNVTPKIHYVTQLPAGYQQGHFVVVDGNLGFISLDGSAPPQVVSGAPAQVISVPQGSKESAGSTVIYTTNENGSIHRALGLSRDVQSSTSSTSIASSYETAGSNLDPHGDSASSLWNKGPRKTGSGTSLNAYNIPENNPPGIGHVVQGPGTRTVYVQNADYPSQGLPRVVSTSSHASDGSTVYYDAKSYSTRPPQGQHQVHTVGGNPGGGGQHYRGRRSSSFDQTKPSASPGLYSQGEIHETYSYEDDRQYQGIRSREHYHLQQQQPQQQQRSPMMRPRPPPGTTRPHRRPQQQGREVETDEGLSMMTSALLTMLDTPEEAAGENYDYDDPYNSGLPLSEAPTPPMRHRYASSSGVGGRPPTEGQKYADTGSRHYQEEHEQQQQYLPSAFYYDQNSGDNQAIGMMLPRHENGMEPYRSDVRAAPKNYSQATGEQQPGHWYPNWQDASSQPRAIHENSQPIRSTSNSHPPAPPHTSSDVGLYLP